MLRVAEQGKTLQTLDLTLDRFESGTYSTIRYVLLCALLAIIIIGLLFADPATVINVFSGTTVDYVRVGLVLAFGILFLATIFHLFFGVTLMKIINQAARGTARLLRRALSRLLIGEVDERRAVKPRFPR